MKLVGTTGNGYWYQSRDAPPVFIPKTRAFYSPTDNAYYAWGAVAPGRAVKQGHYVRLTPGGVVVYAQRPGAPPLVFSPTQVKHGQSGLGITGGGFALHYRGGIVGTLTNPDTGKPIAPGGFVDGLYRTPARDVTSVYLMQDGNEMFLLIVRPGERIDLPNTPIPLEEWVFPWGDDIIINGIEVDNGDLLYFDDAN